MTAAAQRDDVWTVGRLLDWTTSWFAQRGIDEGRLSAELLLAHVLGCKKIDLYTRYDAEPSDGERAAFRELIRRAGDHTPIAYLLGTREFFSLVFEVTPAVLVPRPETEAVVQRTIELCRQSPDRRWDILDVGTGSGCIAIAIAHYAPNARVVAGDISAEAVEVARRNVSRHELDERVTVVEANGVALPAEVVPEGGFDVLVSNPPYISEAAWPMLPPNVRDHEPKLALALDGSDGLVMYRRFAEEAPAVLQPGGRLMTEIGHDQPDAVRAIFASTGGWTYAGSHRNPTDPHARVVEFLLDPK